MCKHQVCHKTFSIERTRVSRRVKYVPKKMIMQIVRDYRSLWWSRGRAYKLKFIAKKKTFPIYILLT